MNRNIWVLGGTGFIGKALVGHLSNDPSNRLNLLIHKSMPFSWLEAVNTFTGSISSVDPSWFERYPPDVVFHLARPAGSHWLTREWASRKGAQANQRLVSIFSRLASPPVVVYVSGSLLYGYRPPDSPALENSPLAPAAYARHYIRNERPWLSARDAGMLDVRFARPGWIAGPGSWFERFFWRPMQNHGHVPCYGSGNQLMSLIHLSDGVSMIDSLSKHGQRGQTLNVFAGAPLSQGDFCALLSELSRLPVHHVSEKEVRERCGRTTSEALTASIPMQTLYPGLHEKAGIQYRDTKSMLANLIRLLENKHGVLSP